MAGVSIEFHRWMSVGTASVALLLSGCGVQGGDARHSAAPARADHAGWQVPLGDTSMASAVRGLTLLVVGDSWARNLGVGAADADQGRRNVVINAGEPGCGLMQPVRIRRKGTMVAAPANCNTWPERWRDLVSRYRPAAVRCATREINIAYSKEIEMAIRTSVVTLGGAAALMAVLAPAAGAQAGANDGRYVAEYRSLAACQSAGQSLVAQNRARVFRCENTYTPSGVPVLDLYVH